MSLFINGQSVYSEAFFGCGEIPASEDPTIEHVNAPLEWLCLECTGDRALLISKYCIAWNFFDGSAPFWKNPRVNIREAPENSTQEGTQNPQENRAYDGSRENPAYGGILESQENPAYEDPDDPYETEWETSSIRQWLNSVFYEKNFTPEEQSMILTSYVTSQDVLGEMLPLSSHATVLSDAYTAEPVPSDADPDEITPIEIVKDKIFLLSMLEVEHYFPGDPGTAWAPKANIRYLDACLDSNGKIMDHHHRLVIQPTAWWTRTMGFEPGAAVVVKPSGEIDMDGAPVDMDEIGVRPAMWVKIEALGGMLSRRNEAESMGAMLPRENEAKPLDAMLTRENKAEPEDDMEVEFVETEEEMKVALVLEEEDGEDEPDEISASDWDELMRNEDFRQMHGYPVDKCYKGPWFQDMPDDDIPF